MEDKASRLSFFTDSSPTTPTATAFFKTLFEYNFSEPNLLIIINGTKLLHKYNVSTYLNPPMLLLNKTGENSWQVTKKTLPGYMSSEDPHLLNEHCLVDQDGTVHQWNAQQEAWIKFNLEEKSLDNITRLDNDTFATFTSTDDINELCYRKMLDGVAEKKESVRLNSSQRAVALSETCYATLEFPYVNNNCIIYVSTKENDTWHTEQIGLQTSSRRWTECCFLTNQRLVCNSNFSDFIIYEKSADKWQSSKLKVDVGTINHFFPLDSESFLIRACSTPGMGLFSIYYYLCYKTTSWQVKPVNLGDEKITGICALDDGELAILYNDKLCIEKPVIAKASINTLPPPEFKS